MRMLIRMYKIAKIFNIAYIKAFSDFQFTSIVPLNWNIFSDHLFLPDVVTDKSIVLNIST